jgi:hypothetical protein
MTLKHLADILTAASEALAELERNGPASTDLAIAAMHAELAAKHLRATETRGKTLLEVFADEVSK